jgi:hypothetical protein
MPSSTVKQRFERTLEYAIGKLAINALNLPRPVPALRHRPYLRHPPHRLRRRMHLASTPPELVDTLMDAYTTSLSHRYLFDRRSWGETAQKREDGFERRFGRDELLWKKDVSVDLPASAAALLAYPGNLHFAAPYRHVFRIRRSKLYVT